MENVETHVATQRLIYRGPAQQVCYQLGEYGYAPVLVPGKTYELPSEFASALLHSNKHFLAAPVSAFVTRKPAGASVTAPSSEQENE